MIFVDTWAWIALADRSDSNHQQAAARHNELSRLGTKYATSDYVIGELVTYLYRAVAATGWDGRWARTMFGSPQWLKRLA